MGDQPGARFRAVAALNLFQRTRAQRFGASCRALRYCCRLVHSYLRAG